MKSALLLALLTGCQAAGPQAPPPDLAGLDAGDPTRTRLQINGALRFAVFGDARPASPNQTAGYPTAIVSNIFLLAEQRGAQFVVGTGDYMFATQQASVDAQTRILFQAESAFHGPVFHTLGNHECTGATDSNCPGFGETPNMRAFMGQFIPKGTPTPWYRVDVDTPSGAAKLLFIAANAWTPEQADWLRAQMADPTAYTFAIRHEPSSEPRAPGVTPSEQILLGQPLTLALYGHYHSYQRLDSRHVISGNGGAVMRSYDNGSNFGLLLIEQQADGNLTGSEIDQATGMPVDTWTITPSGDPAP